MGKQRLMRGLVSRFADYNTASKRTTGSAQQQVNEDAVLERFKTSYHEAQMENTRAPKRPLAKGEKEEKKGEKKGEDNLTK